MEEVQTLWFVGIADQAYEALHRWFIFAGDAGHLELEVPPFSLDELSKQDFSAAQFIC